MIIISINGVDTVCVEREETVEGIRAAFCGLACLFSGKPPTITTRKIEMIMGGGPVAIQSALTKIVAANSIQEK